jgi:DNA-binding NarL/FixJ family response regulator
LTSYFGELEVSLRAARILIADAHEITRIGVKSMLNGYDGYEVCGEALNGRVAVEQARRLKPDLVVLDVDLPYLNGLEAAQQISLQNPRTSLLIFTEIDSDQIMRETLGLGIAGFVLKSDPIYDLLMAAEAVLEGRTFYTSRMTHMILTLGKKQNRKEVLTAREREVVQLLAEGYCSRELAQLLDLSVNTVETHRSNLMRKLKISSVAQLVLYAIRNEIVHLHKMELTEIDQQESSEETFYTVGLEGMAEHAVAQ